MDYSSLSTAADIMNAFQQCQNAGEQIDLFEALATSDAPPVEAFVEILRNIRLESVLALTIQAFGKITDADIRERLKQSDDLLTILSEQAQSGRTDLIRWSAATTIVSLGFDFIAVSQHLTVEPKSIADRIMQAKLRRLEDKNLLSSNDFDEYLNFWIYGNLNALKIQTASISYGQDARYEELINKIFNALVLRAIQDVNQGLQKAESMGSSALEVYENELFELAACQESIKQIKNRNGSIDELIATQVHCLQSRNRNIRNIAGVNLSQIDNSLLNNFEKYYQPNLSTAKYLIEQEFTASNSPTDYYVNNFYKKMKGMANNLVTLVPTLHRKAVKDDCQLFLDNLKNEMKKKKELFENRCKTTRDLKSKLDKQLEQIQSTNSLVYTRVILNNSFKNLPSVNIEEDEQYDSILNNYVQSLRDEASRLKGEVTKFYEGYKKSQLASLDANITRVKTYFGKADLIIIILPPLISFILALFILVKIVPLNSDIAAIYTDINVQYVIHAITLIIPSVFLTCITMLITNPISKWVIEYTEECIKKAEDKQSNEKDRLNDEERKIINLLSI